MKYAFCLFRYFPYSGLSRLFLSVINELASRGNKIDVYVYDWQGDYPQAVNVILLPSHKRTNHTRDAAYYEVVRPFLEKEHYDAVVGFNKMPGLDFYFAGDFCYADRISQKYTDVYRLTPRHKHFQRFEREVFGLHAETILLMLAEQEKQIYQQNYATGDERFVILPPALDRKNIISENIEQVRHRKRQQLELNSEQKLALFVGSGYRIKGLDRALKALASLPAKLKQRTRLMVVGQDNIGPYKRIATNLGVMEWVEFAGGRADVPELMVAADCLIHPAYRETTGNVLLEALASGLPVLVTDTCGYAPHISQAKAGIVLNSPISQRDMNQGFEQILTSSERQEWIKNGRDYGKNEALYRLPEFTADIIELKTPEIINKKLNQTPDYIVKHSLHDYMISSNRYDSNTLQALLTNPDSYLERHTLKTLKNDGTTTVAVIKCDGQKMVVKRYNTKSTWHFFKRSVRMTRAYICWHYAHKLLLYGLHTPTPVGYRENRMGKFRGRSYYITLFNDGETLFDYLRQPCDLARIEIVAERIKAFFNVMAVQKMAHGDMKASNFLIDDGKLIVLDLDSTRSYLSTKLHENRLFRDKQRFLRNWENQPEIYNYFKNTIFSAPVIDYIKPPESTNDDHSPTIN